MILVTGFEPFGQWPTNPSAQVAEALVDVAVAAVLPVEFVKATEMIRELMLEHRPSAVLSLGLAPGRERLELERVAINLIDAAIPDNVGSQPIDEPIVDGAPAAFFSTLPVKAMARAIEAAGVPAGLSLSAGTYGCNAVMYAALEYASRQGWSSQCGFLHLPPADRVSLDDQIRGVRAALAVVAQAEASYAAGTIA